MDIQSHQQELMVKISLSQLSNLLPSVFCGKSLV